jgi:imidazolonepropionase-like amidohydrolase
MGKLADLIIIGGKPDEYLNDLPNNDLFIREGRIVVKDGKIYVEKHTDTRVPYLEKLRELNRSLKI